MQQDIAVIEDTIHLYHYSDFPNQRKVIQKVKLHVALIKQSSISKEESLINEESYVCVVKYYLYNTLTNFNMNK